MSTAAVASSARAVPLAVRAAVAVALLGAEFLALTLAFELPARGPALPLVEATRVLLPVLLGAAAAGVILAGPGLAARLAAAERTLPPWRPLPWIALQLAVFGGLALSARPLLGRGAPPLDPSRFAAWLVAAAATAVLAVAVAVPLRWAARAATTHAAAPLLAVAGGLAAWRTGVAVEEAWGTLSRPTLHAVAALLWAVGEPPQLDVADRVIGLGGFRVRIASVCSGADGAGLVLVFQGLWLALGRDRLRFPRALLLLPLGAAAAFAANAIRLAALVLIGASGAEGVALGGFHSKAGWILFLPLALGSVALAERWAWLRRPGARPADALPSLPDAAAAQLAPLLATLAAALVTGAVAAGPLDRLYGVRALAGAGAVLLVRRALPRPSLALALWPAALGAAVGVVWCVAPGGDGATLAAALRALAPAEQAAWIGARLLGSVLVVPIVEELAFRGFLLPWLAAPGAADAALPARRLTWSAVLLSSAAFGALHGSFLLGTAAGIAFAYARARRGRLSDAVVAHVVANAVVALAVLALGRWDLWA